MAKWVKKKPEGCHEETAPLWYITYADMITQITAFFVVMFSLSELKADKVQALMDAFQQRIGLTQRNNSPIKVLNTVCRMAQSEAFVLRRGPPGKHTAVQTLVVDDRTRIIIGGRAGFDPGEWRLTPEMEAQLEREIGPDLKGYRNFIEIRGHTASPGGEGSDPTAANERLLEIGYLRAKDVHRVLAGTPGIDPRRLRVVSCADHEPLGPNDTAEGRAMNRRVEVIVTEELARDPGPSKRAEP